MSSLPFWRLDAKGGESVGICECVVCLLLSRLNYLLLSRLNLDSFTSYGVRHMHSIYPSELVLYCAIFMLCYAYYHALVSKI